MRARAGTLALAAALLAGCTEDPEAIHFVVASRNAHHITFVDGPQWTAYAEYLARTAREAERWCARHGAGARAAQASEGAYWATIYQCVPHEAPEGTMNEGAETQR